MFLINTKTFSKEKNNLKKSYTAVVLKDFPPLYITNEKGEADGFGIDMLDYIANDLGIKVNILQVNKWEEAIELVKKGEADFIPSTGISEKRDEEFIFSKELEIIPVSYFIRTKNEEIKDIKSLKGKKVALVKGSATQSEFENTTITAIQNEKSGIIFGKVEYVIKNSPSTFFVLNDGNQILAYYPKASDLDVSSNNIGLSQSLLAGTVPTVQLFNPQSSYNPSAL